jgi:hypothetical protein
MKYLNYLIVAALISQVACLTACKKNGGISGDDLPVFGTCNQVSLVSNSHLTYDAGTGYTFHTSGGGIIIVDRQNYIKYMHDAYPGFNISWWSDATVNGQPVNSAEHESLNGKHIKDRSGSVRTLLFPDGAKLTLVTDGEVGPVLSITIFDGKEVHHINTACNTLEYSTTDSPFAKALDDREADGEAAIIEFTTSGLLYVNLYFEATPGNKVMNRVVLGEIFRDDPSRVNDDYDDPRYGNT